MALKCMTCKHARNIPGDCHISCVEPDFAMTGDHHGIKQGWFMYPWNFDPLWGTKECDNYADRRPDASLEKPSPQEGE